MKRLLTTLLSIALMAMPLGVFAQSAGSYPASLSFGNVGILASDGTPWGNGESNQPPLGPNDIVVGHNFTVDVIFNTGGAASSGADVIVEFNPMEVTFVSAEFPNITQYYPLIVTPNPIERTEGAKKILEMARTKSGGGTNTTGTGTFAKLTFTPLGQAGDSAMLDFVFAGQGETVDSNITSATQVGDLLGNTSSITLALVNSNPVSTNPSINSISPTQGDKNLSQDVTIYGTNFGTGTGKVYIGTKLATVVSWSATQIVITVPTEPSLTSNSTRQIKVQRTDGKETTLIGYTYTVTPLPNSGPEDWIWAGIAASAFALSFIAYRRMSYLSAGNYNPAERDMYVAMLAQENKDDDQITYRF